VVAGALTYKPGATSYPATNVTVTTVPDLGVSAQSDASGNYALTVPVGIYSVVFSGNAFTMLKVDGVSVLAGQTSPLSQVLVANNPLVLGAARTIPNPAGFGTTVALGVTVSGGTAPYAYSWAPKATNPTAVTLSSATDAAPTFVTGTFAAIAQSGNISGLNLSAVPSFVGISSQQAALMSYNFDCTVTDAQGFSKTVTVAVAPATRAQGHTTGPSGADTIIGSVPVSLTVIANFPGNTTAATFTAPAGSTATLSEAATSNPWFIPDKAGTYTLSVPATDSGTTTLTVNASKYVGSDPTCGGCHTGAIADNVAGKFEDWSHSAHGDFYFRDDTKMPPEVATQIQSGLTNAATVFAAGVDGVAAGNHYSEKACGGCHTVGMGYKGTGGFRDATSYATWTFPDNSTIDYTRFASMPADLQALAGIQCESCHGPLGQHVAGQFMTVRPKPEWRAEACGVCHDAPPHHDKTQLWSTLRTAADGTKHGHANYGLALAEGTMGACAKCHAAQGFGQWADAAFAPTFTATAPSKNEAQPQTCQTCHDPHTTKLRMDTSQPLLLENGYLVSGAGPGQLCMACHQGRRGIRDDAHAALTSHQAPHQGPQADVVLGKNFFFLGDLTRTGSTISRHFEAVEGACVGCHMKFGTEQIKPTSTNHSFIVDKTVCTNCHPGASGEQLFSVFEGGMADLSAAAAGRLVKYLTDYAATGSGGPAPVYLRAWDPVSDSFTSADASSNSQDALSTVLLPAIPAASDLSLRDIHGRQGAVLRLAAPISLQFNGGAGTAQSVSTLYFQIGSLKSTNSDAAQANYLVPLASNLTKALWNYFMLESDRSKGAHNPTFVMNVLGTTTGILKSELP
jgi:hypothetical protein